MRDMKQNMMEKLIQKVKEQSVNSLGNIYPEDIIDWLEGSKLEVKKLINYLHKKRVILYKYKLKCKCGEVCTIYEKKGICKQKLYCEICGEEYSVGDIKEQLEIVYEIDKKALLSLEDESVDFKELPEFNIFHDVEKIEV